MMKTTGDDDDDDAGVRNPMAARLRCVAASLSDQDRGVALMVTDDASSSSVGANGMLLALSSDFFEAALRSEWSRRIHQRVDLADVSAADVRAMVAHSEGDGVGWQSARSPAWWGGGGTSTGDVGIDIMLRIQDRFVMPQLRAACASALRASPAWFDASVRAAAYGLWDVVVDALVAAAATPWTSLVDLWAPDGAADELLMRPHQPAPDAVFARVLTRACFPYMGQRIALAARWWAAMRQQPPQQQQQFLPEGSAVAAALVAAASEHPLWLPEAGLLGIEECDMSSKCSSATSMPPSVVAALMRALVRTSLRMQQQPSSSTSYPSSSASTCEHRRGMAMIEASLDATTAGPGTYQMALVPVADSGTSLHISDAYVSEPARLASEDAVYHVYLEEEARLGVWWRRHGGAPGGIHVLLRRM